MNQQEELPFLEMLTGGISYCEHTPSVHCEGCLITVGANARLCYNPYYTGWLSNTQPIEDCFLEGFIEYHKTHTVHTI